MAGPLGFEPRVHGIKTRCLTAWLWPNEIYYMKGDRWGSNPRMPEPQSGALTTSPRPPYMAGVVGIEPTLTVLETVVLPLNYTPAVKI